MMIIIILLVAHCLPMKLCETYVMSPTVFSGHGRQLRLQLYMPVSGAKIHVLHCAV